MNIFIIMNEFEASSVNELLFTVFTTQYPEWGRFRGGHYDGRATHDPLGENLVSNFLSKSIFGRLLPLNVRQLIGRLTGSRVKLLQQVCVSDCDGKRLWKACLYSKQIRRLLDSIPPEGTLWKLYTSWTWDLACLVKCSSVEQTMYIKNDPCSPQLSHVNRLHLRGFKKLNAREEQVHSRPAYLPSSSKLSEWDTLLEQESGMDQKLQIALQIREHFQQTHALFEVITFFF